MFIASEDHDAVRSTPSWRKLMFFGGLAGVVLVVLVAYLASGPSYAGKSSGMPKGPSTMNTPYTVLGIRQPPAVPASEARLDEEAEIIGVSVGGKYRAYAVRAFDQPLWHVVNDLLGEVPVTVTYCDRCDFAKVFSGRELGAALDIALGGWVNNRMMLRLGDVFFLQDEDPAGKAGVQAVALVEYPYERITWKAWKAAHPETDVYLGVDKQQLIEHPGTERTTGKEKIH
jgi:hypothetical protein